VLAGLPNLIVESVPAHNTGEAIGLVYSVACTVFVAVGTSVVSLLLVSSVVPTTTAPTEGAWRLSIGVRRRGPAGCPRRHDADAHEQAHG